MKKAGMLVAVVQEMNALKRAYGEPLEIIQEGGFLVYHYQVGSYDLYVTSGGVAGEIMATAATQMLITKFGVSVFFNFGVVGGLTEEISHHRVCVVDQVVHSGYDTSAVDHWEVGRYTGFESAFVQTDRTLFQKACKIHPDLKPVICASSDVFVEGEEAKRNLHQQFGADICEMEAAGILYVCKKNEVPCLMIKMVSDGITGGAEEYTKNVEETADIAIHILSDILMEKEKTV